MGGFPATRSSNNTGISTVPSLSGSHPHIFCSPFITGSESAFWMNAYLDLHFDQIPLDRSIFSYYDINQVDITIHPSARRHGILDADMIHAYDYRTYGRVLEFDNPIERVLYIGTDQAGNLLEIVAIRDQRGGLLIIHAMRMTKQYQYLFERDT